VQIVLAQKAEQVPVFEGEPPRTALPLQIPVRQTLVERIHTPADVVVLFEKKHTECGV
jgi:hypothetical protein